MVSAIISRVVILVFGTLYPAYASYKAVKNKNVREYVKWMMYWIVFALFTCVETFADVFISWLPFYYEIKILFVLWMLSPATKGSSILYRKFVHPQLIKREEKIDSYIAQASDKGYTALLSMGSRGLSYATEVVVKTAVKGQAVVVEQMKKSYSMNDLSVRSANDERPMRPLPLDDDINVEIDEIDNRAKEERDETNERLQRGDPSRTSFRQQKSSQDQGLHTLEEQDEDIELVMNMQNVPETTQDDNIQHRPSNKHYKHEEVAHYATLPRTRSNRKTNKT